MNYKTCLIVGKFMPPHKGHEYMIRFAKNYAEHVHVVVDCLETQTIAPEQRKKWLEEEITGITVHALKEYMPQEPSDTPDFYPIWRKTLLDTLGFKPDVIVAAMDYGWKLAEVMECDFVPIDIARESIPISATMLREDTFKHWDYLIDSAKPDFVKKICVLGPESTGKSIAAQKLAKELNTIYVSEYAKAIIAKQNGQFFLHNVDQVAMAQVSSEKALAKFTNKIMVCDSSAITTKIYSELLFKHQSNYLNETINAHKYDMHVLFYPDTDFVSDIHRNVLHDPQSQRLDIFHRFENELKNIGANYITLHGTYDEKYNTLLDIARKML